MPAARTPPRPWPPARGYPASNATSAAVVIQFTLLGVTRAAMRSSTGRIRAQVASNRYRSTAQLGLVAGVRRGRFGGPFGPGSTYCDTVLTPTP
jgi:hypothetical protein